MCRVIRAPIPWHEIVVSIKKHCSTHLFLLNPMMLELQQVWCSRSVCLSVCLCLWLSILTHCAYIIYLLMFPLFCTVCAWMLYHCNMVRWAWWDWGLPRWLTTLLQCFDSVKILSPKSSVNVPSGTLSLTQLNCCCFDCSSTLFLI